MRLQICEKKDSTPCFKSRRARIKKVFFIFFCFFFLFLSALHLHANQVVVTADKAEIYAEPDIKSPVIETVEKETVLNLFQKQRLSNIWYYIYYRSEKRKSSIAGFVKVTSVEFIENVQKKLNEAKSKLYKEKKIRVHPASKKENINTQKLVNATHQIKKTPIKPEIKSKIKKSSTPEKTSVVPVISKSKSIIVTATKTNIYKKPDIKSDVIETVNKGVILTLSQMQKSPKIWHHISFYSEKRKTHISGFVKSTAVEDKDKIQETLITQKKSKEIPSPTYLPLKKVADTQKINKVVSFQKISEPPVDIKIRQMPNLFPFPTLKITAFQDSEGSPEKLIKEETNIEVHLLPSKRFDSFPIAKEGTKGFEKEKQFFSVSKTQDLSTIQKIKEEKIQINQQPVKAIEKPQAANISKIQNISKAGKIRVFAESADVYGKPNIKSHVIDTLEKGTILTLSQKQKSPRIWKSITFYSKKRKSNIKGYVKATAVEKIDYAGTSTNTRTEQMKIEDKTYPIYIPPTKEMDIPVKLEKDTARIRKFQEEEIKTTAIETGEELQSRISKAAGFAKDSLIEVFYGTLESPSKEHDVIEEKPQLKVEEESINVSSPTKEIVSTQNLKRKNIQGKKPNEQIKMKPRLKETRAAKKKFKLITLGMGYGQSYGGAGGFIQVNTKTGFAFHAGIGYFPASFVYSETDWVKGKMLYSGGLKYYIPLKTDPVNFYLDLQYCGIGVEAAKVFSGKFYNGPLFDNVQKTLWGPSFFGGIEVRMGLIGINGAVGFSYNITEADWLDKNIFLTFDFGMLLYF